METKPGWKTTEAIGGLALAGGIYTFIEDAPLAVQIAGICAIAALGVTYMISRTLAKK